MRVIVTGHRPPRLCGGYTLTGEKATYHNRGVWVRESLSWRDTNIAADAKKFFLTSLEWLGLREARVKQDPETLASKWIDPQIVCGTGMAQGADQLFAEACIDMNLAFEAFVPHPDFSSQWPESAQIAYQGLLRHARVTHYTADEHYKGVEVDRDREMVKWVGEEGPGTGLVLAVWDGEEHGGTFATVRRAAKQKIETWCWNPKTGAISKTGDGK